MKNKILPIGLYLCVIPLLISGQTKFYNLQFEETDTVGKTIFQWIENNRSVDFVIDPANQSSGRNSLFINVRRPEVNEQGARYEFLIPEHLYHDMRSVEISVDIMTRGSSIACLWFLAKKDKAVLGCESTYYGKGPNVPAFDCFTKIRTNFPMRPYTWEKYNFTVSFEEDPTVVKIGFYINKDRAWFDHIIIKINGQIYDKLVFEMTD